MKKTRLLSALLAFAMVFSLGLSGCQEEQTPPPVDNDGSVSESTPEGDATGTGVAGHKVGFIQLTLGTTYHAAMSEKFEALAKEKGVDVSMTVSQNRSAEEQLKLAEDLIAQGVEAIVLNPVGDEIVPSVAQLCENANIPLICVDNTTAGTWESTTSPLPAASASTSVKNTTAATWFTSAVPPPTPAVPLFVSAELWAVCPTRVKWPGSR